MIQSGILALLRASSAILVVRISHSTHVSPTSTCSSSSSLPISSTEVVVSELVSDLVAVASEHYMQKLIVDCGLFRTANEHHMQKLKFQKITLDTTKITTFKSSAISQISKNMLFESAVTMGSDTIKVT